MSLIEKKIITNALCNKNETISTVKHFPVSSREWNNSIYVYNKYALNLLPVASLSAKKLIKSYFSLFNSILEKKLRTKKLSLRFRRLSKNKIFIGRNEFKHTNDKVVVDLYLFNRQSKNYDIIIKRRFLERIKKRMKKKEDSHKVNLIKYNKLFILRMNNLLLTLDFLVKKYEQNKRIIIESTKNVSEIQVKKFFFILENSFFSLIDKIRRKSIVKLQLYFYYKQLKFINKSKFNYTYLQLLKEKLEMLFSKNIEFNLINLKRFFLSSDILSETIKLKLTNNRRGIFRHLNKLKNKIKIKKKSFLFSTINTKYKEENTAIRNNIIEHLKYKDVTGFRLEARGRLTRRHTASRSVTKLKYKGNLLNIDSSHRGLSTVLLKGNLQDNLQYTKSKSKTRIGSFGLKGWVSGN